MNEYGFWESRNGYMQDAEQADHKKRVKSFDMELAKVPNEVFYFILVFGLVIAATID